MNIISTGSIFWKILKSFGKGESRFVVGYFISFILDANCHTCPIHPAWVGLSSRRIESDCDWNRKWEQRRLIGGTGSKRLTRARGGWRCWQTDSIGSNEDSSSQQESVRERQKISFSQEAKQARYTWNIYRSESHDAKQARYTCNIRRSLSHEARRARYTWNLRRF